MGPVLPLLPLCRLKMPLKRTGKLNCYALGCGYTLGGPVPDPKGCGYTMGGPIPERGCFGGLCRNLFYPNALGGFFAQSVELGRN